MGLLQNGFGLYVPIRARAAIHRPQIPLCTLFLTTATLDPKGSVFFFFLVLVTLIYLVGGGTMGRTLILFSGDQSIMSDLCLNFFFFFFFLVLVTPNIFFSIMCDVF